MVSSGHPRRAVVAFCQMERPGNKFLHTPPPQSKCIVQRALSRSECSEVSPGSTLYDIVALERFRRSKRIHASNISKPEAPRCEIERFLTHSYDTALLTRKGRCSDSVQVGVCAAKCSQSCLLW